MNWNSFNNIVSAFAFFLLPFFLAAQCDSIENYQERIVKAKKCIEVGDYSQAQKYYNAAKIYCKDKSDEVELAKDSLFLIINNLRELADSLNLKNKKLIEAFYFYDGKLALACKQLNSNGSKRFGFVNKYGDDIIKYKYFKAEQFDYTGYLNNLTFLNLSYNQLKNLPVEIGNLNNLTTLDLLKNHLTDLPVEIENLNNLTYLSLWKNQLVILPPEIGNLSNLTALHLAYNEMSILPDEITNLKNLTYLTLDSNKLTKLPIEIGNLNSLNKLELRDNPLSEIEKKRIQSLLPNCEISH